MTKVLWLSDEPMSYHIIKDLEYYNRDNVSITQQIIDFPPEPSQAYNKFKKLMQDFDMVGGKIPQQLWIEIFENCEYTPRKCKNTKEIFYDIWKDTNYIKTKVVPLCLV